MSITNLGQQFRQAWQKTNKAMLTPSVGPEEGVRYWRERIFLNLYFFGMLAGLIVYAPSVILLTIRGHGWLALLDTLIYITALGVFFSRKLSFEAKCRFTVAFLYLIGSGVYLFLGPSSGGPIWLFGFPVIAAVFLGMRATIFALILNAVTLGLMAPVIYFGLMDWALRVQGFFWRWSVLAINFLFVNSVAAISVVLLVRGMKITEQSKNQTQQALKVSEEKFAKAFQESPVWVVLSELETGAYFEVNEAYLRGTGYTREEVLGKSSIVMGTWADPSDRRKIKALLDADGYFRNFEVKRINKAGEEMYMLMSGAVIELEGTNCLLSVSMDMTEMKKAQQALELSEERFRLTFETSPDSININRASDGLYVDINQGFTNIVGYTKEEAIGQTSLDLDIWHDPKDRERLVEKLRTDGRVTNMEAVFRLKDGGLTTGLMSASLLDLDGDPHIISITRDISDLKKAEKERAELQAQLQHAQKMEAVGTLAGGIAHDFNNILAAITGYAELALEDTQEGKEVSEEIGLVLRAADRARDLVKRILTFSRKMEVELVLLDLNHEVIQAADILKRTIPKMIDIELHLADEQLMMLGDSGQLEQVLLNLGTNARDAMADGGRLIIETTQTVLDEEYCRMHNEASPGRYVLLRVSDTGMGMSPAIQQQIFDPFFTTKEVGSGTGMGLAMVFGIVKSHRGYITCYSEPHNGTTFKLYFPAADKSAVRQKDSGDPMEETEKGSETILVVDDEPFIRDIVQRVLSAQGYQCVLAVSGEDAVELFAQGYGKIKLVLLDVSMPGMGGYRCLQRLLEIDPDVRVIIASGYALDSSIDDTLKMGAACFVSKPFKKDELITAIRQVLDE